MHIRYLAHLKKPIILSDQWQIPFLNGSLRAVTEGQITTGFEINLLNQPISLAPKLERLEHQGTANQRIVIRDNLLPIIKSKLESALSFLQCYFNIEILIDEIEAEYIGETEDEKKNISIHKIQPNRESPPPFIPFDLLTRSIMAAENADGPRFEATLVSAARTELIEKKFIDSFRYSFLLIESLYGNGKFRSAHLKEALKANSEFQSILKAALHERTKPKHTVNSDTEIFFKQNPSSDAVIDFLVDKRGFYFHGNTKRKDGWKAHEQGEAESLALFALDITSLISHEAATPIFNEPFVVRHFENAKNVGAIMTVNVEFQFQDPLEKFERKGNMNVNVPGTKLTPKMALYITKEFLREFENGAPVADLKRAKATVKGTGEKVFELQLFPATEPVK